MKGTEDAKENGALLLLKLFREMSHTDQATGFLQEAAQPFHCNSGLCSPTNLQYFFT